MHILLPVFLCLVYSRSRKDFFLLQRLEVLFIDLLEHRVCGAAASPSLSLSRSPTSFPTFPHIYHAVNFCILTSHNNFSSYWIPVCFYFGSFRLCLLHPALSFVFSLSLRSHFLMLPCSHFMLLPLSLLHAPFPSAPPSVALSLSHVRTRLLNVNYWWLLEGGHCRYSK